MIFEKPIEEKGRHLKPFYIRAHINNKTLSQVIVDGGDVLNAMPTNTLKKIGKGMENLTTTNMKMINFTAGDTHALGVLVIDITVGTKTKKTILFVVDAKPMYTCYDTIASVGVCVSHQLFIISRCFWMKIR